MSRYAIALLLLAVWILASDATAQDTLVTAGAAWRYLDDGSNQGSAWRAPGFDDSAWPSGPAQLGYGDGDEATIVSYGPDSLNKHVTTYFRHTFSVGHPGAFETLQLRLLRDDGAVVYLNGTEIKRSNLPPVIVFYLTLAISPVDGIAEETFFETFLEATPLVAGENVLAVEVHQESRQSPDLSFDVEMVGWPSMPAVFRKSPYIIYGGVNTQMKVLWQMYSSTTCTIQWGLDTTYAQAIAATEEFGDDNQHAYTFTHLTPGQKYFFRVNSPYATRRGSFRAAPPSDVTAVELLAYGDTRTNPHLHNQVAAAMVEAFTDDETYQSLIVMTGDLVSNGDREADWDTQFFTQDQLGVQRLLSNTALQSCMGNHERSGDLFQKYFPYPFVDRRYWSFDYGPVHIVCVDQYTDYTPGSPQYTWLESDLAGTDRPWKIIYLHEPGWSAGGHGNEAPVQDYIQPLCEAHGVALVLAGHNHYYARCEVNGVQHITTGGGAAPLYTPDPSYPHLVTSASVRHFCKIAIDGNSLEFTALEPDGNVIDQFELTGGPTIVQQPPLVNTPRDHGLVLLPAYPNTFSTTTTISFDLPAESHIGLTVYSITGQLVRSLVRAPLAAGMHNYDWDGTDDEGVPVSSGVYIYELATPDYVTSNRVTLVR